MNPTFEYVVKKYNLKIGKEFYVEIPNMGRNDLAKLFAELDFNTGAEIGVALGHYSEVLCKANPNLHLYGIDPWKFTAYDPEIEPHAAGNVDSQIEYDRMLWKAVDRLAKYNVTLIRKESMAALDKFEDGSLDFVYIDANHDFMHVTQDIHCWKRKVRISGIVAGHDYAYFSYKKFNHVKRVVEVYTRCYRMIPYFIAGTDEVRPGETRDRFRSWFWIRDV